jgi:UDP-N-acetylglucosamine 2-epimerase (non-hydrolysing)/GDP/UDP-N,N'-diacetylbacillosamine 2-epimerase (hydrolysing)
LISEGNFASKAEVIESLDLDITRPLVLFTQHSISTEFDKSTNQVEPSLEAIKKLANEGVQVILTYPNNDAGGQAIIEQLIAFGSMEHPNTKVKRSLGRYLYHGVLALARDPESRVVCLGNSSSGLKETPAFGCPTVNIGSRQEGRLRGENVIDSDYSADGIYKAVIKGLFDENFRKISREAKNPYSLGEVGPKIAHILASTPLNQDLIRKRMMLKGETKDGWYR